MAGRKKKPVRAKPIDIEQLDAKDQQIIKYRSDWINVARPKQLATLDDVQNILLWLAGRGFGKSRSLHEAGWWLAQTPNTRIALVAPTLGDLRRTNFKGESGFQSVVPPLALRGGSWESGFNISDFELHFANGSLIQGFSSETPERLRGPQFHHALCDELAAWVRLEDTWDMLNFCLRLGDDPKIYIATTPKPVKVLKEIVKAKGTRVIRGGTRENTALTPKFLQRLEDKYAGTRLGRQELDAEILEDIEGALWMRSWIDAARMPEAPVDMERIVISVDPAGSINNEGDEIGIVAAGRGTDGRGYVFEDYTMSGTPQEWATRVIHAYHAYGADAVVAESNYGGAMVKSTITQQARIMYEDEIIDSEFVNVKIVNASRGKIIRAEPVSALYEQGRVSHLGKPKPDLEDQMCNFTYAWDRKKDGSPDRLDALVWAFIELIVDKAKLLVGSG